MKEEEKLAALKADLRRDGYEFVSFDGSTLVIDDASDHEYSYRREVWELREDGCGSNNSYWGPYPGGFEFCRSGKL